MIYIGCDRAGTELKAKIIDEYGGRYKFSDLVEQADYPDAARTVCESVLKDPDSAGILICGTGIGMSLAANKYKGIRAAVCGDIYSARMAKEHNNANVICIGARVIGETTAREIVDVWLGSQFQGGRHGERLAKIAEIEKENFVTEG